MTPEPRMYGAEFEDGSKCQEYTLLLGIQYVYSTPQGTASTVSILKETRFRVRCHTCGEHVQVEREK